MIATSKTIYLIYFTTKSYIHAILNRIINLLKDIFDLKQISYKMVWKMKYNEPIEKICPTLPYHTKIIELYRYQPTPIF